MIAGILRHNIVSLAVAVVITFVACLAAAGSASAYTTELQALRTAQAELKAAHAAQAEAEAALQAFISALNARQGDGVATVPSALDEQTLFDLRRAIDAAAAEVARKFTALQAAARAFQAAYQPYGNLIEQAYTAIDLIQANATAHPQNRTIAIRAIRRGLERLNFVSADAPLQMLGGLLDADLPAPQTDDAQRAADAYERLKAIVGSADSVQSAIAGVQNYLAGELSERERRFAIEFLRKFIEDAIGASDATAALSPENAGKLNELLTQLRGATDVGTINAILSRLDQIQTIYDLFRSRDNEIFRTAQIERLRAFLKLVSELAALDPTAGSTVKYYIDTMDAFIAVISEKVAEIRALRSDVNLVKLTELGQTSSPWPHEVWQSNLRAPSDLFFRQAAPDDLIRVPDTRFEPGDTIAVGYRKAWFYEDGEATLVLVHQNVRDADSLLQALSSHAIPPAPLEGSGTLQLPEAPGRYELRIFISHRGRQEVTARQTIEVGIGAIGVWVNDRGDVIHVGPPAASDRPGAGRRVASDAEYLGLDLVLRAEFTRLSAQAHSEGYAPGDVLAQSEAITTTALAQGFFYFRYPPAVETNCRLGLWEIPLQIHHDRGNTPESLTFFWRHTAYATDDCRQTDNFLRQMAFRPITAAEALALQ